MSMLEKQLQQEVNNLLHNLSVDNLAKVIEFIRSIVNENKGQTLSEHLSSPIYEDEVPDSEEEEAVASALEDIKNGRVYSLDELKRRLGDL